MHLVFIIEGAVYSQDIDVINYLEFAEASISASPSSMNKLEVFYDEPLVFIAQETC
jgi:hypothetical protein